MGFREFETDTVSSLQSTHTAHNMIRKIPWNTKQLKRNIRTDQRPHAFTKQIPVSESVDYITQNCALITSVRDPKRFAHPYHSLEQTYHASAITTQYASWKEKSASAERRGGTAGKSSLSESSLPPSLATQPSGSHSASPSPHLLIYSTRTAVFST